MLSHGAKLKIEYVDANQERTSRLVTFHEFGHTNNGRVYLVGFCHLRNDVRHFRVDRIQRFTYSDGTQIKYNVVGALITNHGREVTHLRKIDLDIQGQETPCIIARDLSYIDELERIAGLPSVATDAQIAAVGSLGLAVPFLVSDTQAHALLSARSFAEFALEEVGFWPNDGSWFSARAQLIAFIVADPSLRKRVVQWSNRSFSRGSEGRPRPTRDAQVQQIIQKAAQLASAATRSTAPQQRQRATSELASGAGPVPRWHAVPADSREQPARRSNGTLWLIVVAVVLLLLLIMSS